ncbi:MULTISPECIES: helix-turn-helix transcriptional regulator [unclassified Dietzia]|uniref:helix-turn-helix transcriptional regulator n=1 Tax=unclassified Dietzia TaxID=2617939 RepID=UPI0015FDF12E|nr:MULTISPECIES: helix-turn-helix transcriptional regulator [unclassified Dietzia]MBB1023645.1 helix-turn-helix transcriptional regulator [Dietzia sp. DQ12-76]MBB1028839.1 helix-turn-helix transcriptional regulator [Dietzia sp. DQ11-38-2]
MAVRESDVTGPNPVREYRKEKRVTQAELAEAVGVSRQTIIAVERGDYSPSVYLAIRIARVLERSVEELFILEEEPR